MEIEHIIYAIFVIVFWIGPRVLKAFMKGQSPTIKSDTGTVQDLFEVDDFQEDELEVEEPVVQRTDYHDAAYEREKLSTHTADDKAATELNEARSLLEKSIKLIRACEQIGEAGDDLKSLAMEYGHSKASDLVESLLRKEKASDSRAVRRRLGEIRNWIATIEKIVFERVESGYAEELGTLDLVLQDYRTPYIVHSRRLDLDIREIARFVSLKKQGKSSFGIRIDEGMVEDMGRFSELAFDVAQSYWSCAHGLTSATANQLKLPNVMSSMTYFYSTGRITLSALLAAWLQQIFVDVCATCQIGPNAAKKYFRLIEREEDLKSTMSFSIDNRLRMEPMPLYLRMHTVLRVLEQNGFDSESADYAQRWENEFDNPETIVRRSSRFSEMPLPTQDLKQALFT